MAIGAEHRYLVYGSWLVGAFSSRQRIEMMTFYVAFTYRCSIEPVELKTTCLAFQTVDLFGLRD